MNKNKKIAMAAVATVMAGALVVPLAACNPEEDLGEKVDLSQYAWNVLKENGDLDYSAYQRETPVTLNIAIGHNNADTSTAFKPGNAVTLADGKIYAGGAMKPAWAQMGSDLNITWNDVFAGKATNANLKDIVNGSGKVAYKDTDMFTTDLSVAVQQVAGGTLVLNLAEYLDYMPNFKAFLNANPIVYLSLLQDGMQTEGANAGQGQALYVAPYFDGNDDIERYCIIRQDWADIILNGNTALATGEKFTDNCAATTSVTPYMTGLETLEVDITLPEADATGNYTQTGKLVKNYANVKTQIADSGSALYQAYNAIASEAYPEAGEGNIVAIMNAAIAKNANVTGDQLATLFRAYVDACYTKTATDTTSYYAADKRSDLFNGYDAAWDVDDLVAMLRCVMTNQNTLLTSDEGLVGGGKDNETGVYREKRKIYGIAPRSGQNDRTPDMVRLACQLYGARGADSRFEYTYIDSNGDLQDARNDAAFYQALENMNKLAKEGLVANYTGYSKNFSAQGYIVNKYDPATAKEGENAGIETFMMYDYCQTQTSSGFFAEMNGDTDVPDGYNFAPILTPVAKWDVNGKDGIEANEYFRFTESWRSTKTSGLALNGRLAYNKDKLIAALQFVDYLYSADGQIVSTYGPMATYNSTTEKYEGGFWEGKVQTNPVEATYNEDGSVKTSQNYFTYKGVKYAGREYKGNITPKITDTLYDSFRGVGEYKPSDTTLHRNFTNYARYFIGSTLPIGVKDQSFEDQLTSTCGKGGSAKVAAALKNKTASGYTVVRGMTLEMNENDWWYTCVPTGLPTPTRYVASLNNPNMNFLKYVSGEAKTSGNKDFLSLYNYIILTGISGTYTEQEQNITLTNLGDLVTYMQNDAKAKDREEILQEGWKNAKSYWDYLKPVENN